VVIKAHNVVRPKEYADPRAAAAEVHSCPAADATVGGLAADGWEWSTTFGLCRAAIALAKENNGLDDGLYHLPLQGCGVPDLSNAETAQAQLNRRSPGTVLIEELYQ
jgi:hypothetical protein